MCVLWDQVRGRRWHMYRLQIYRYDIFKTSPIWSWSLKLPLGSCQLAPGVLATKISLVRVYEPDQNFGTIWALPLKISVGVRLSHEKNFLTERPCVFLRGALHFWSWTNMQYYWTTGSSSRVVLLLVLRSRMLTFRGLYCTIRQYCGILLYSNQLVLALYYVVAVISEKAYTTALVPCIVIRIVLYSEYCGISWSTRRLLFESLL